MFGRVIITVIPTIQINVCITSRHFQFQMGLCLEKTDFQERAVKPGNHLPLVEDPMKSVPGTHRVWPKEVYVVVLLL